jgi:hypothetical protein
MSGVLALALKRKALSRGTLPSAVPMGHALDSGTNGTVGTIGTVGTPGTISTALSDWDPVDMNAIEERAALAADSVPACYLDAWARLQCQRPLYATEKAWRRAIDDAGRFLDAWGPDAATMRWTVGELFDAPRDGRPGGLIWQLTGERVRALGEDRAQLSDGRTIKRCVSIPNEGGA